MLPSHELLSSQDSRLNGYFPSCAEKFCFFSFFFFTFCLDLTCQSWQFRDLYRGRPSSRALLENVLSLHDWSSIYDTNDPNIILETILTNVNLSLDTVAPLKEIKLKEGKPKLSLRKDTLAAMRARNKARKAGNKGLYKRLRNTVTKLVKRDKIQSVMTRLGNNPGPKKAWQEAKEYLGKGSGSKLPECTTNTDPKETADHQNEFFVNKIEKLVTSMSSIGYSLPSENSIVSSRDKVILQPWASDTRKPFKCETCDSRSIHEGKKPFKCEACDNSCVLKGNLQHHVASVHEGKKPFKCEDCDNSSVLKGKLKHHVASVHEGKNPFKCEGCDKGSVHSVQKGNLQHHVASFHEGKKPFKCESFDKSSVLKSELQHHVASFHEGKKPFKGEACYSKFSNSEKPFGVDKAFSFSFVSASDVTKIISNLKNTKALGIDNISTEVWKKGMITLAGPIARLCTG